MHDNSMHAGRRGKRGEMQNARCRDAASEFASVHNVNGDALAVTLGDGLDDGPDLFCDASLAADDLAHILRRNVKLQNGALAVLALRDRHGLGLVNKLLCHIEQEFLHRAVPLDQRTLAFFKSAFTVSVG